MKIANLFKPGTRAFWGTTYALGLALFDQYLERYSKLCYPGQLRASQHI
jgi:hypothetical protein